MTDSASSAAGLFRRLAALFYDSLLLLGVWFIASAFVLLFTHGEKMHSNNPYYTLYLFLVTMLFFGWFWRHGGQTLGMRAWRIRLVHEDGGQISWSQVLLRCLAAIPALLLGGLGYWWILWDKEKRSWHDRFSHTRVVEVPKNN
jgi:uncharacterized RDD family membrane protein YckC